MDLTEQLTQAYRGQVGMPWRSGLSGPERVWMAVYPPKLERRVRARTDDFKLLTNAADHGWLLHDLTKSFATAESRQVV